VREFAKVDGSLAHLYGYHHIPLTGVYHYGSQAQKELLKSSARENWVWGNSGNVAARSSSGRKDGEYWILNGSRPFSSGSHIADYLLIAFENEDGDRLSALIPTDREGLVIVGDWDGIGQRQTGSGTVRYDNLRLHESELLGGAPRTGIPPEEVPPITTITSQLAHCVLLNIFVGSAQGALEEASEYTRTTTKAFAYSGVDRAVDDPWVKSLYGDLVIRTLAATELAERASRSFDAAWSRGFDLTVEERGRNAIDAAAANVFAGDTALDVTAKIFELTGARSATRRYGFDRFWRNVRTHTLHNPAEYKKRTVGTWYLTGEYPGYGPYR
jgi:alkylation response protein AidB-like acyl-CoA dehydrogenase